MNITIIVKYAKQSRSDRGEVIRKKALTFKRTQAGAWNWQEFVAAAVFHASPGERIVAIIEGGYH